MPANDTARSFLAALADPKRSRLLLPAALVVAHPDDETIACGAQLARFSDIAIIHVTDGAPRSLTDAKARGFPTAEAYAAKRHGELNASVVMAGVSPERLASLAWPDQEASLHLAEIAKDLAQRLAGKTIVLTHAYEGGHPDHDATAFAVHAACAMIAKREAPPDIIEFPLYRAGPEGRIAQQFEPASGASETVLDLTEKARALKRAMFAAHASQREVLSWFTTETERFRIAPSYDFTRLPNGGDLLYERQDWGMSGERWVALVREARAELGLA